MSPLLADGELSLEPVFSSVASKGTLIIFVTHTNSDSKIQVFIFCRCYHTQGVLAAGTSCFVPLFIAQTAFLSELNYMMHVAYIPIGDVTEIALGPIATQPYKFVQLVLLIAADDMSVSLKLSTYTVH